MPLLDKHLFIKKSTLPNSGKGLFTRKFIPKGTSITEYKGKIVTWKEVEAMPDEHNGYVFYVNSRHCIDAWKTKRGVAHFANDARGITRVKGVSNNSEYMTYGKRCYIDASKDIEAGEEILVDYGSDYWRVIRYNLRVDEKALKKKGKTAPAELPHHKAAKRQKGV